MLKRARIPEKEFLKRLLDELQDVDSLAAAFDTFCKAITDVGFNGAMFITRASGPGWVEGITETSYPADWINHYVDSGYTRTDPTRRFALRHPKPFFWSEVFPHLRKKDMRVFNEAKGFGLLGGFTVPITDAGRLIGGIGLSADSAKIEDPRLKSTLSIAAQIFCTVYDQLLTEEGSGQPPSLDNVPNVTKRELDILAVMATGASNPQISDLFHISQSAVEFHIKNLFEKLGVDNRVAVVVKAIKLGLITLD